MTVEEIFSKIIAHMIRGMMVHDQLSDYYRFLGMPGYARFHEKQYEDESDGYVMLKKYFIDHYNRLVPEVPIENPNVIPNTWYQYKRQDVDVNTKKNGVKDGLNKWIAWEKETKTLYETMFKELMNLNEVAAALFLKDYVLDVDRELKKAEKYQLNKKANDYSMDAIMSEQRKMYDKYR